MYQVINDSQQLAEWMKHLPTQAEVFERSEVIRNRLIQSAQDLDLFYSMEQDLEKDTGVFLIILYGTSRQTAEHYRKILDYFHLDKSEFEYEDRYTEPERSTRVTFRLYLRSSDDGVEIVEVKNQTESLDSRLKQGDWWQENNECLCLQDIHKPPLYFEGSEQQWIEAVTSYQYSYPVQWQELYDEYLDRAGKTGNVNRTVLGFHRSEDGYLRKDGEKDVYLKIKGIPPIPYDELNQMGTVLLKHADEMVSSYLEYCGLNERNRNDWKKR